MPYIKTLFTEQSFQSDFIATAMANGWEEVDRFRKVAYQFNDIFYGSASGGSTPWKHSLNIMMADHALLRNSRGDIYGIARICEPELQWGDLPAQFKNGEYPDQVELNADSELRKQLHDWMFEQWDEKFVDTSKIYFYMLKDAPTIPDDLRVVYPSSNLTVRDALDIELLHYMPQKQGSGSGYEFLPTNAQHEIMQSPIVPVSTREVNVPDNGWLTNWWPDSKIRVEGYINDDILALIIQADNTAAFDDNNVPTIPIYFGSLVPFDSNDTQNAVLFAGTAVSDAKYKYDSETPHIPTTNIILPTNKQYPKYPGNGIDNLIVKRTKLGAYYQAYSLSYQATPEKMPPDRKSTDGKQYASAWKNQSNDEYQYQFNPSRYTKRAHVSRAIVTHPDEGNRGYLKGLVMTHSVGLRNGVRLRLKKNACPDAFEYYKYFVVDSVSPLTKRPAIASRPAGFGIFEKEE
jgi:hypothetical protein